MAKKQPVLQGQRQGDDTITRRNAEGCTAGDNLGEGRSAGRWEGLEAGAGDEARERKKSRTNEGAEEKR